MSPNHPEQALAELWGIGEADPLILGAVLAAVVLCALVYIVQRSSRRRSRGAGRDAKD